MSLLYSTSPASSIKTAVRCVFLAAAAMMACASPAADLKAPRVARSVMPDGLLALPSPSQAGLTGGSPDVRRVAEWVRASADNRGLPFAIVDKVDAELFLFDGRGALRAATPVLLGVAHGDDSPPGIGSRKLSLITAAERVTPAGRFVAAPGHDLVGRDILWLDYDAAFALHRATDPTPGMSAGSRAARLASPSKRDNRVSYGCINVPARFYDHFVRPTFQTTTGIVYVLPETRSVSDEFTLSAPGAQARREIRPATPGA